MSTKCCGCINHSVDGRICTTEAIWLGRTSTAFLPERLAVIDIRRFLDGETVNPGEVFTTIHTLFKQYIDFRSEIESRILALWVVGTYFYQMFPAYPYLALNGPKNSSKSTTFILHVSDDSRRGHSTTAMAQLRHHVTKLIKVPVFSEWTGYLWQAGQAVMLVRKTRGAGGLDVLAIDLDVDS